MTQILAMGEDRDTNKSDAVEAVETAMTDENEKIVVMIPESSSESSLGEFSPLFLNRSRADDDFFMLS